MDILADINQRDGKTVIVTLHQVDYAMKYCRHAIALKAGKKYFDGPIENLDNKILNELYGSSNQSDLLFKEEKSEENQKPITSFGFAAA